MILGGEPTLHPDLFAFIDIASELSPGRVEVWSNGYRPAAKDMLARIRSEEKARICEETIKPDGCVVLPQGDFFLAPVDFGEIGHRPCYNHAAIGCGISVDAEGYTLCSVGGALNGCHLDVVFFSGNDVQAAAGTLQTAGTVGVTSSVAGLPFQPDLIFGATAGIDNTTNQTNGIILFGAAYDDPVAGIVQAMLGRGSASNRTGVMRRSDGFVGQPFTTINALWRGQVTAFNPDGFDLTIRD